eukprot:scaffold2553_cov138-Cylindrotheca_fusiformis.AAC.7
MMPRQQVRLALALLAVLSVIQAFSATHSRQKSFFTSQTCCRLHEETRPSATADSSSSNARRNFLASSLGIISLGLPKLSIAADSVDSQDGGVTMYKTTSGLKYIELEAGDPSTPSPRYGQLCVIAYTAYLKLPNKSEKEKFDKSTGYVVKHGNGRMIPGLDEGLHTMKKGELRRLVIPPKLGFTTSGLGPLPDMPWNRIKLNRLIDEMVAQRGGNLVYDIRLLNFFDDEADQGYYEDDELSAEEMEELQRRLNRSAGNLPT